MEIDCRITPPATDIPKLWDENKDALIEFTRAANTGIRGIITYQNGLPARYLSVQFDSREPIFKTSESGEYFALLIPGTYNITVMLNCDPVYSSIVHIHHYNRILIYNVTLDNLLYFQAFYYRLDKYALFCTKSKASIDCSIGNEKTLGMINGENSMLASNSLMRILIALILLI